MGSILTSSSNTDDLFAAALRQHGATFVRDLKSGGQKRVCLVEKDGAELVMKLVSIGSSSPDALARAHREVELLGQVAIPELVQVKSNLVEIGAPVTGATWLEEKLDGDDLSDNLGPKWTWDETKVLATDVSKGLIPMHERGIVHRDLSTNNIRRRGNGSFVVMDPGFARHTLKSGITIGGQPGTLGFLTPEHLQSYSGSPTPASDVFGVGILMFLALAGCFPIPSNGDDADYMRRVSIGEVEDIAKSRPDLEIEQRSLVTRALHAQPARRFRNAQAFLNGLEVL